MRPAPSSQPAPVADGSGGPGRVLVVGAGYIGRNMVQRLARDRPVVVLTRRVPGSAIRRVARVHVGDAGDRDAVRAALDGVDHVVWCAGGLLPSEAERRPDDDAAATLGPLAVALDLLADRAIPMTYLSSGGTVYGNPALVPVPEDAPTVPVGAYGRARLSAERLVLDSDAPARILRCANVYGRDQPVDRAQGAVAVFVDRVRRQQRIVLYGGGAAVRDFVHIDDVVDATADLLTRQGPAVVNVGSGRGTSIAELLRLVERTLRRTAVVEHRARRPFDVGQIVLDITRLQALTGFRPRALETGLASLADVPPAVRS